MKQDQLTRELAEAFLRWPLPETVCADPCATKQLPGRVGTNLLTLTEAEQMFREVVLPQLATKSDGIAAEPRSAEARFIDQDHFAAYVANKVNPERAKEGLQTVSEGATRHLYDVLTSGRYR